MVLIIFSKSVKISWCLTCILSVSSIAICTCIFLRCFVINTSQRSEVARNVMHFPDALWYCLIFDTILSFVHLWTSIYFYSCLSRYTFQVLIPVWIIFNVGLFYSSLSVIVFPVLQKSSYLGSSYSSSSFSSSLKEDNNSTAAMLNLNHTIYLSSTVKPHQSAAAVDEFPMWLTSINGFPLEMWTVLIYYGVFTFKTLAFSSLILTLFDYTCKLRVMYTVLDKLRLSRAV